MCCLRSLLCFVGCKSSFRCSVLCTCVKIYFHSFSGLPLISLWPYEVYLKCQSHPNAHGATQISVHRHWLDHTVLTQTLLYLFLPVMAEHVGTPWSSPLEVSEVWIYRGGEEVFKSSKIQFGALHLGGVLQEDWEDLCNITVWSHSYMRCREKPLPNLTSKLSGT